LGSSSTEINTIILSNTQINAIYARNQQKVGKNLMGAEDARKKLRIKKIVTKRKMVKR
jgi:hypothetical protein